MLNRYGTVVSRPRGNLNVHFAWKIISEGRIYYKIKKTKTAETRSEYLQDKARNLTEGMRVHKT